MKQINSNPEKSPNANSSPSSRTVSIGDHIVKINNSVPTTSETPPPPMPKKSK